MCLAVPGRIIAIHQQDPTPAGSGQDPLWRVAEVDFGGVRQQVSLACLSEARVGDQVLVHVGVAITRVDGHEPLC
jgi:hydrogenase expression/formation protein HypC